MRELLLCMVVSVNGMLLFAAHIGFDCIHIKEQRTRQRWSLLDDTAKNSKGRLTILTGFYELDRLR